MRTNPFNSKNTKWLGDLFLEGFMKGLKIGQARVQLTFNPHVFHATNYDLTCTYPECDLGPEDHR